MPIRPIDLQTMIPKVQEHRQAKDATVNQSDTDQQQANMKNKELVDQKQHQVSRMDRRDQMKIRDEGKRRKGQSEAETSANDEESGAEGDGTKDLGASGVGGAEDGQTAPEKSAYDKEKKLKSLQYHKFDMKV